jgi:hypothetical protein
MMAGVRERRELRRILELLDAYERARQTDGKEWIASGKSGAAPMERAAVAERALTAELKAFHEAVGRRIR